ncbi:MAG: biopolymer transporter ExbD [Chlamydiales bacterium]|nr:biopolymer transporter ExbD [Chlamydiales bacterium]
MKFNSTLETTNALIDLTPLVDVVFLMLVFFIITSDILPLKSLNIENPTIERPAPPRTTQILVVVDAQNVIYIGSKREIVGPEDFLDSLRSELEKTTSARPGADTTVVLSIDRRVEYGDFLRLFSLAQETGAKLRLVYNDSTPQCYE